MTGRLKETPIFKSFLNHAQGSSSYREERIPNHSIFILIKTLSDIAMSVLKSGQQAVLGTNV
jgi:hypothetical protein